MRSHSFAKTHRRGAAAVEFALVAPIFIMFLLGIFEFGRAMMVQQALINATREGARKAIFVGSTVTKAKDAVVSHLASSGVSVSPNKVTVSPDPTKAVNGDSITVSVSVPYTEVAWLAGIYMKGKSLTASTTMSFETTD